MSNTWFRFKQFTIEQDRCAMKVGTDGVILGAWASAYEAQKALDIGTGTGLLAMMLAQKNSSLQIDALEIDHETATQAAENVKRSDFRDRIQVINISFQDFIQEYCHIKYDLIICNPPYFTTAKKGINQQRNLARHDDTLPLEILFREVPTILSPKGKFVLIIPAEKMEWMNKQLSGQGLFAHRILEIIPSPGKAAVRFCFEISTHRSETTKEKLMIETGKRHHYSEEYRILTNSFYL